MTRKAIGKKVRFEVFKRDSFTCQYCGASAPDVVLQVDHIDPVSKGGEHSVMNFITSCQGCNAGKSDRLISDDSVIKRQKEQLDQLNERREQIEMMLKWREAMNDIAPDQQRNAVTRFMHGDMLQRIHRVGMHLVDDRSDATLTNGLREVWRHLPAAALHLLQLSDLLVDGQLCKQIADACVF